jgi:hypothetical protein
MKIAKTALVSTVSLVIAMSVAALSVGPSLAAQAEIDSPARKKAMATPRLPITGKQTCLSNSITLPTGVSTNTGLSITFFLGAPKSVALIFSSEISVAVAGDRVNLDYSIDGGAPIPIGPEFFANDIVFAARTAYGVVNAPFNGGVPLSAGTHTITPFLRAVIGSGTAFFRCFAILNTGV